MFYTLCNKIERLQNSFETLDCFFRNIVKLPRWCRPNDKSSDVIFFQKQEFIRVGCVPPAAIAVRGVCLSACWDTPPRVWAWRPPRCGPGDPPSQTPQLPPWVLAWRLTPGQTPQLPPWVWSWKPARHAGIPPPRDLLQGMLVYHLQCMLGYLPLPWTESQTHVKT